MSLLKNILSIFGINGPATPQQSLQSKERIKSAIAAKVEDITPYTLVYGYTHKAGVTSTYIYNYAIGFRVDTGDVVIVVIDTDSYENWDVLRLKKDGQSSIAIKSKCRLIVKSKDMKGVLDINLPYRTRENAPDLYLLPIEQAAEIEVFNNFVETNF